MKVIFLDCFSGISGDMTVGALCDLGVKPSTLEWELSKVDIGDFHMHFERAQRKNIEGVKFSIHEGATHTHDQDEKCHHEHEHGHHHDHAHEHEHEHEGSHEHGHAHSHQHAHSHSADHDHGDETEHARAIAHEAGHTTGHSHGGEHSHAGHEHGHHHDEHEHGHGHHGHEHTHGRNHAEIRQLIQGSELSPFVKEHVLSIFQRIAVAEGKIHGVPSAEVGFHEVGALDSIADIICACAGLEALGIDAVHVSALHDGCGSIECAHGTFPLPAPATLEILAGIPIAQIDEPHELITPTGAAILAEFGKSFGLMPRLKTEKVGYGIGSRDLASRPNVLRAVLGELVEE